MPGLERSCSGLSVSGARSIKLPEKDAELPSDDVSGGKVYSMLHFIAS